MSTKDLIASNKEPNTKKVFKLAEETIRKITQLHLNNPKINRLTQERIFEPSWDLF